MFETELMWLLVLLLSSGMHDCYKQEKYKFYGMNVDAGLPIMSEVNRYVCQTACSADPECEGFMYLKGQQGTCVRYRHAECDGQASAFPVFMSYLPCEEKSFYRKVSC
jgi:hypothetical protein